MIKFIKTHSTPKLQKQNKNTNNKNVRQRICEIIILHINFNLQCGFFS